MPKLLIFILMTATIMLGCESMSETSKSVGNIIPDYLNTTSLIYRPSIQQGNVVTQEMINEVKPGMARRQVRYLLGTPQMVDVFHQNRWDYIYTMGVGSTPKTINKVSFFFEDDKLVRIEGDKRPTPVDPNAEAKKEIVVSVPDWDGGNKSLWQKTMSTVGLGDDNASDEVSEAEEEQTATEGPGLWDRAMGAIGLGNADESEETRAEPSVEDKQSIPSDQ